jgi:cyanophycinase
MSPNVKGKLLIIGGAEDRSGERVILRRFVDLAGGARARLVVISAAARYADDAGETYRHLFSELTVGEVRTIPIPDRRAAQDIAAIRDVETATGVFFTGGDQLRLTTLLGGTTLLDAVEQIYVAGTVVAGTSAGAAAMSSTMIAEGDSSDAPKHCTVKMAPGMGLVTGVVIDQHFAQRGRIGRLLSAISQNPSYLGIGVDEDTAVEIRPGQPIRVLGSRTVTIIDGRSIIHTNTSQSAPEEALAITGVTLHVLPSEYGYHLEHRKVVTPDGGHL